MKKTILVVWLATQLFFPPHLFAFEFQDYKWGESMEQVMGRLEKKGVLFSHTDIGITYKDALFDEPCDIFLAFTPESRELAFVTISWDSEDAADKVMAFYMRKHRNYTSVLPDIYFWMDRRKEIKNSIYLNTSPAATRLYYYGGEYYEKYVTEERAIGGVEPESNTVP